MAVVAVHTYVRLSQDTTAQLALVHQMARVASDHFPLQILLGPRIVKSEALLLVVSYLSHYLVMAFISLQHT
jgi:hypothetical protein